MWNQFPIFHPFLIPFPSVKWMSSLMRTCPGLEDVERLFTLNGLVQQIHLLIRTTYLTQSWHEAVESTTFLWHLCLHLTALARLISPHAWFAPHLRQGPIPLRPLVSAHNGEKSEKGLFFFEKKRKNAWNSRSFYVQTGAKEGQTRLRRSQRWWIEAAAMGWSLNFFLRVSKSPSMTYWTRLFKH